MAEPNRHLVANINLIGDNIVCREELGNALPVQGSA